MDYLVTVKGTRVSARHGKSYSNASFYKKSMDLVPLSDIICWI